MTLTCGPPTNIDVGQISGSEWTFNGQEIKDSMRININISGMKSILTVKNVILADIGKSKLAEFLYFYCKTIYIIVEFIFYYYFINFFFLLECFVFLCPG